MTPSVASEPPVTRSPGRLGRAVRYAVLLLILVTLGSGPPSGQAQVPAGHAGPYSVFPRTFAPGQTVVIRGQTAFPPPTLPGVNFAGVSATTVRATPDRMELHVIVPRITGSGILRLDFEANRRVDLGPFTLIGGGGGPAWIQCTGSAPTYEVIWSHLQSPAEVPVGTKVTAEVRFHDGIYIPGHWEGETPTPGVWPWISKSSFPESGSIGRDGTKLYVRISASHAIDICDLALGDLKVQTTVTGTFDAGAGGPDDNNNYTSGDLGTPTYDYDPGDDKVPVTNQFWAPPWFPWTTLISFPNDEGDEDGEIHGEVTMDTAPGTYELLNFTNHKKRGRMATLCTASVIVKPFPADGSPIEDQEIPLSLRIISIDCGNDPVAAGLIIMPSDVSIANEDYQIYSKHQDGPKLITTWPYQIKPDTWDNSKGGQGVHVASGAASSKIIFRPKAKANNMPPRPVRLSIQYKPVAAANSEASYRVVRMTQVSLQPVEVVELSPKTKDENNNDIAGSEKPNTGKPLTPFVEIDPHANKIAHREIKVRIGGAVKDKKITWTLEPLQGATPATIRGQWEDSPTHEDRFEASKAYGPSSFRKVSQTIGETKVGADGNTAIRVNVPPIGFNQVRIKIQIEGMNTPIDLIDMEVPAVVIIDPGHGGPDSGTIAISDNKVLEKDLALAYSLSLRQKIIDKFQAEKRGLRLVMTRKTTGEYMENSLRANLARDRGADVFLSIHFNHGGTNLDGSLNTTARGTEYITRSSGQVNAAEDDQLGGSVQGSTLAAVRASDAGAQHRDAKSGGFAVVSDSSYGNTAAYHPIRGVIIEVEFLSHTTAVESVKLSNATGTAIKTKFAADVSADIYNNILNQP